MGLTMARMASGAERQAANAKSLEAAGIKSIAELRAKPLAELPNLGQAGLVIDGYLIPEDLSLTFAAGRQNDVDVLAGSNKDENTFGGGGAGRGRGGAAEAAWTPDAYAAQARTRYGDLADRYLKLYPASSEAEANASTALVYNDEVNWNMRQFAAAASRKGKKGYAYFFTRVPRVNGQPQANGASHTVEISYAFNHPFRSATASLEWDEVDRKLADTMSTYWVNFATSGDPNGKGLPQWPPMRDITRDKVIVLGDTVQQEATVSAEKMNFFTARHAALLKVK
jgi:para-nitrobenzyl esterase